MTGRRILDVGAGTGAVAQHLTARGHQVRALDPVPELDPSGRVEPGHLPRLPQRLGSYDCILCLGVLHHLCPSDQIRALRSLSKHMTLGGHLVLALRHGARSVHLGRWPVTVPCQLPPGLSIRHHTRRPSVQTGNRQAGVCWTWLVLRKAHHTATV
ncbi:MAG: class I SAM-dependent methyltransferase [Pseudomonadota bacterium]